MRITTKFGSQELDIYNSTYDFSKFACKSEINELAFNPKPLTAGTLEPAGPACQGHQSRAVALTGQSSPTASSPVTAPVLRQSLRPCAHARATSWTD